MGKFWIIAGIFGIPASLLILFITAPFGPAISPDSVVYLGAAENILNGKGYTHRDEPVTHFPPGYSLVLAGLGLLTKNLVESGRVLNALLFGINLTLIALMVYLSTSGNLLTTAVTIALFLTSLPILIYHLRLASEPLFIALSLGAIILFSLHAVGTKLCLFIAAAILLSFASLTRYAGVSLLLPTAFLLFKLGKGTIKQRIRNALLGLVISATPVALWLFKTTQTGPGIAKRTLRFNPDSLSYIRNQLTRGLDDLIFSSLFLKSPWLRWTVLTLIATLALTIFAHFYPHFRTGIKKIGGGSLTKIVSSFCILGCISYLTLLLFTIIFVKGSPPLDTRLLLPVLIFLITPVISFFWLGSETLKTPLVRYGFGLLLSLILVVNGFNTARFIKNARKNGVSAASYWLLNPKEFISH